MSMVAHGSWERPGGKPARPGAESDVAGTLFRLTVPEALSGVTRRAARALGREGRRFTPPESRR